MSELQNSEIQFGASGEESLQDYRPINRASVFGLALGVLSAASLLHWLLLSIALAAVLISSLALLQIRARHGEVIGRKAALAGIVLGIFFLAFGTTREYSRRGELDRQARQHAEQWLELVREGGLPNLYNAFEYRQRYPDRQPVGTDLALRYGEPGAIAKLDSGMVDDQLKDLIMPRENFRTFFDRPLIQELLEAGTTSELTFVKVAGRNRKGNSDTVILEYLLRFQKDGHPKTTRIFIKMALDYHDNIGEAHWHVAAVDKDLLPS